MLQFKNIFNSLSCHCEVQPQSGRFEPWQSQAVHLNLRQNLRFPRRQSSLSARLLGMTSNWNTTKTLSRWNKTLIILALFILFLFPLSVNAHQILFYYNSLDGTDGALLQCVKILQGAGHKVKVMNVAGKSYDPTGDLWGPPFDQVWDMRFVNRDKENCGSGSPLAADYFTEKWRSKAVSYLNHCGKLFIAGEHYQLIDRDEGLYRFLMEIHAVNDGYDDCPPSANGNSTTDGKAFYPVHKGLGPVSFYGEYVGGIPLEFLNGTSFVDTRNGWQDGDGVDRSVVSGWAGNQLGGLIKTPLSCRGKLFMVWDATMWTLGEEAARAQTRRPVVWDENSWFSWDSEPAEERDKNREIGKAQAVTKKFFPAVANWLGNAPCHCEPSAVQPIQAPTATLIPYVSIGQAGRPVRSQLSAVSSSTGSLSLTPTTHIPTPMAYLSSSGAPETIVFTSPPVNVYMGFRDGVGEYRLEVLDALGNHLKTLFDQSVTPNKREAWASWDGSNDLGIKVGAGSYFAVLSKDGHFLKMIVLSWRAR